MKNQCLRCGNKNVEIHTCSPNASCRVGIREGIQLARDIIFKMHQCDEVYNAGEILFELDALSDDFQEK